MNNCFILLLLLFCCGNNCGSDDFRLGGRGSCGGRNNDDNCGCGRDARNDRGCGRDTRNDCGCGSGRDARNNDSCMERGFNTFPSPGGTCGCEEKE